jgi:hypothetical protein
MGSETQAKNPGPGSISAAEAPAGRKTNTEIRADGRSDPAIIEVAENADLYHDGNPSGQAIANDVARLLRIRSPDPLKI